METKVTPILIEVVSESGAALIWDRLLDEVSLDSSVTYAEFIKMTKQLKRTRNRESFSADTLDDD
ncbi:hypothetical protein D3C81_1621680 [compost metagenome]